MRRLPVLSGRDLVRALGRLGYEVSRTRGSHARLACPGRPTLSAILGQAKIPTEELRRLLP